MALNSYLNSLIQFSQQGNGLFILLGISLLVGALVIHLLRRVSIKQLNDEIAELALTLKLERAANNLFEDHLKQTKTQLANTFNQLSNDALKHNNDNFLKLAEENLKRYQSEAKSELNSKEKAIEQLLKPITDALGKTTKQIHDIEKDRKETYGHLRSTLEQMTLG